MSKTPKTKTDAIKYLAGMGHVACDRIEELETELADKDRQLAEARAEIERLKCCGNCEYANHKFEICEHPENSEEDILSGRCELWGSNSTAAAERGE